MVMNITIRCLDAKFLELFLFYFLVLQAIHLDHVLFYTRLFYTYMITLHVILKGKVVLP